MRAASIRSFGIDVATNWRIRKMPKALAAPGMYSARGWSIQPSASMIMKVGIMFMNDGSSIVPMTRANSAFLKRNSNSAKA